MSFSFIKKLTLVGQGGIGIASYPDAGRDIADTQLQSGFISAIVSYSKEVHQAELEAVTMHDRTLTFIKSGNYILVVEFSNAIDKNLMNRILTQMSVEIDPVLSEYPDCDIPGYEAQKLLEDITRQEWIDSVLNNFGLARPLGTALIKSKGSNTYEMMIEGVLNKMESFDEPFMLPLNDANVCLYVVPLQDSYYYLELPINKEIDLFRMAPLLYREVYYLSSMDIDPQTFMSRLRDMPDLGYKLNEENEDLLSIKFLNDNIKKRLDAALDGLIKGSSVIVIGEKITTKIAVNSLQIFTQHLNTNVNQWLGDEATDIPRGTTGMSRDKFEELKGLGTARGDIIILDLDRKRVENGQDNKYLQKFLKDIRKDSLKEAKTKVSQELDNIVSNALELTGLLRFDMDKAEEEFKLKRKEIKEKGKFDLILSLSSQRNPALESLLSNLSATLEQAESFLGEF